MMTAHEYRTHADRCVKLARDAVTAEMHDEMIALADRWARLAKECEQEAAERAKTRGADAAGVLQRLR